MCHFPSWIETQNTVYYLEDKDVPRSKNFYDYVGHQAIKNFFGKIPGKTKKREGFPCHPIIAKAIRNGKMTKLAKVGGFHKISLDTKGNLHGMIVEDNRADSKLKEHSSSGEYVHGKRVGRWVCYVYGDRIIRNYDKKGKLQ